MNKEMMVRWQRKVDDENDPTKATRKVPNDFRQAVARDMFSQLTEAEKTACTQRAKEIADAERRAFEEARAMPPHTTESLAS